MVLDARDDFSFVGDFRGASSKCRRAFVRRNTLSDELSYLASTVYTLDRGIFGGCNATMLQHVRFFKLIRARRFKGINVSSMCLPPLTVILNRRREFGLRAFRIPPDDDGKQFITPPFIRSYFDINVFTLTLDTTCVYYNFTAGRALKLKTYIIHTSGVEMCVWHKCGITTGCFMRANEQLRGPRSRVHCKSKWRSACFS